MEFKAASDQLTSGYTLAHIAEETGMSEATIRRARLDPDSSSYRSPPLGWQGAVERLARRRAEELLELADELAEDAEVDR